MFVKIEKSKMSELLKVFKNEISIFFSKEKTLLFIMSTVNFSRAVKTYSD